MIYGRGVNDEGFLERRWNKKPVRTPPSNQGHWGSGWDIVLSGRTMSKGLQSLSCQLQLPTHIWGKFAKMAAEVQGFLLSEGCGVILNDTLHQVVPVC